MNRFFCIITIGACFIASCTNEKEEFFTDGGEVSSISATADGFQSHTRSSISNIDYSVKWEEGDIIGVFPMKDRSRQIAFDIKSGSGTNKASFNGEGWGLKNNTSYMAYYPYVNDGTMNAASIPLDFSGQVQVGNGSTEHLKEYDYMYALPTEATDGNVSFKFRHIGSLIHLKLTMPRPGTYTSIILWSLDPIPQTATYDLNTNQLTPSSRRFYQKLELRNVTLQAENEVLEAFMMIYPINIEHSGNGLCAYVTDSEGNTYCICDEALNVNLVEPDAGLRLEDGPRNFQQGEVSTYTRNTMKQQNSHNSFGCVDLGLSVKWSKDGYFPFSFSEQDYSWGEVFNDFESTSSVCTSWSDYRLCEGSSTTLTKYNNDLAWGHVDGKSVLESEDDIADFYWGLGWRIPTTAEFEELLDPEKCDWTVDDYTREVKVTSKVSGYEGNFITFHLVSDSSIGKFWTSSLYTSPNMPEDVGYYSGFPNPSYAWSVFLGTMVYPYQPPQVQAEFLPDSRISHNYIRPVCPRGSDN